MLREGKLYSAEELAAELFHWLTGLDYEECDAQVDVTLDKYEAVAKLEKVVIAGKLSSAMINRLMREYE
jgi:hypothetical protein